MDANARFTVCKKLEELKINPDEFLKNRKKFMEFYRTEITNTYIKNARWSISLAEEFFKQSEEPVDYVVFVYNLENRKREYWKLIEKAIEKVGTEVIERLSKYAGIYAFGIDKQQWINQFPLLKELRKPGKNENRAIFGFGFQHGDAYDKSVEHIRKIDYFIRASQLRLSGMYFPAMDNALFVLLTHPPSLYNTSKLVGEILIAKKEDFEHDRYNIYSEPKIYEEWSGYIKKPPSVMISSISRVPKYVKFE